MQTVARRWISFLLVSGFAPLSLGAGLTVDGQTSTTKTMGETLSIGVTGTPGKLVTLIADVLAGPTPFLGQSLPIGFSPLVQVVPLPALSATGDLVVPITVPSLPSLDQQTIYLLAVVFDDGAPFGLDFSNGADFTIVAPPTAGADQATLVGRTVLLDGGGAALPTGLAKPMTSVVWTLISSPSGSSSSIANPNQPFATLTPDRPGDYVAQLSVQTPTGMYVSSSVIHAWRVDTTPLSDGGILVIPSFGLSGTIAGPPVASLTLDGQPIATSNGSFGPIPINIPSDGVLPLRFRLTHADGTTANHLMTLFQGLPQSFSAPSSGSLNARIGPSGLAKVADAGEATLQELDLKGILLALPPQQIANTQGPFGITLFSATIDFTNLTYNPAIQLQLTPTAGGIDAIVTISNIKADFNVFGEIVEVDYNLGGYITTSPTTISARLVGTAQNGKLDVAVTNVVVNRANFDFELNGFIGTVAEAFVIESAVKEQVEATIASTVAAELGPGIEDLLNTFVIEGSLQSVLDVDVSVQAPITGVVHDANGVTIALDGIATTGVIEPGSPAVTHYRATPVLSPTFGLTSPGGLTYDAGLAAADDFINQVLAAGTAAGLLDGDLTTLFPSNGANPVDLPTDQLALLFPGGGFDHFPIGTPVGLRAHGTVPPILTLTTTGSAMGVVRMDNIEVEFEVDTPYGPLPMLRVSLSAKGDVFLSADMNGTLALTLNGESLSLAVVRIFPDADPAIMDQQVDFLGQIFSFALPQLVGALGNIPLPSLEAAGLGLTVNESALLQGTGYLGLFGDLSFVP